MSQQQTIVLYRYDTSPFSVKIDNALLLKQIPHVQVHVAPMLPRPEINKGLGLTYRRIPVLAVGNDVYIDTSLIVSALERRFPVASGYPSLFPPKKHGGCPDKGLLKALSRHYVDNLLFPLATTFIAWHRLPEDFRKDREALRGAPINVEVIVASRSRVLSTLSSHLALVEEQLNDNREWLFDTELPSLLDLSASSVFQWTKSMRGTDSLFDAQKFPHTLQWLTRFNKYLDNLKEQTARPQKITGEEAAKLIGAAPFEPYSVVGFDTTEASHLGFKFGDLVSVAPDDTGKNYPTIGKVVAINMEEITVETKGQYGVIRCHFPRIGYTAKLHIGNKL